MDNHNQNVDTVRQNNEWASVGDIDGVTFSRTQPPPYTPSEIPTVCGAVHLPHIQAPVVQTVVINQSLKKKPMYMTCPSCLKIIVTRVEYANTRKTHMIAGFICGFTFWCSLCCLAAIPYMTPTFKKAIHYCPNCKKYLGSCSN